MTEISERTIAAVLAPTKSAEIHAKDVHPENNDPTELEVERLRGLVCCLLLKNEKLRQCLADTLPTTDCVDPVP